MNPTPTPTPTRVRDARALLGMACLAALTLAGCSSDNDDGGGNVIGDGDGDGGETVLSGDDPTGSMDPDQAAAARAVFALKETGEPEPEYLIATDDLMSGTLSTQGAGNEQLGWNFYYPVGDTVFVTGYENFATESYRVDQNGDLAALASFSFEQPLEVFGNVDDETFLATDTPRDGSHTQRLMYLVDADTGLVTEQVRYTIDDVDTGTPGEGTVGWPTALVVRDDQLFVPFHKLDDSGAFTTPEVDTAFVAVYDWPLSDESAPAKIISDERTSHIGVNGNSQSLIATEDGDLYSYSMGTLSGGFDPASTRPSGLLRIPAGSDEFDPDYFFDVEAAGIGGKLFWMEYLGDDKALGRVVTSEEDAFFFSAFGKDFFNQKLVFIDLEAQTVSDIADVPLHQNRYSAPLVIEDGFGYVSVETATDAYVYRIDAATGEATRGAKILSKTVKGFFFPEPASGS